MNAASLPASAQQLLFTPEEAARLLRVGRTTVFALIKTGALKPVHIGRACRLSAAELARYVHDLETPPPRPSSHRRASTRKTTADQRELW